MLDYNDEEEFRLHAVEDTDTTNPDFEEDTDVATDDILGENEEEVEEDTTSEEEEEETTTEEDSSDD